MVVGAFGQPPTSDLLEPVEDRVTVVERGILVEFPTLDKKAVSSLTGSDLVISEGRELRDFVRVSEFDRQAEPWRVLLYFDLLLSDESLIRRAALALSERASTLTGLGPVRVVASSGELTELGDSSSPEELARILEDLGAARVGRDTVGLLRRELSREEPGDVLDAEVDFLRERADSLLVTASETCEGPPCVLLLVSDGFNEALDLVYPSGIDKERARQPLQTSREVARELVAMGWTTITLPLKAPPEPDADQPQAKPGAGTDFDAWKADVGGVQMGKPAGRRNRFSFQHADVLDVHLQARLQPLEDWAEAGAGAAIRLETQIDEELGRLDRRWWLFFRGSATTGATPAELDVSFAAQSPLRRRRKGLRAVGLVRDEIAIRAPIFTRALATPALAGARLRSLTREHELIGALKLVELPPVDATRALKVADLDPLALSALEPRPQSIRVSRLEPNGELSSRTVTLPAGGPFRFELEPFENGWILVESLEDGRWGAIALD